MSLKDHIASCIAAQGPITMAEYMAACLMHPTLGYYTTRDPFGQSGDFITAPEISQMFGELIGLCLAQAWMDQGAPTEFVLAELGPGRGTMMADILRATAKVPGFHAAARITLLETSLNLRAVQAQTLAGWEISFVADVNALPDGPLFVVANEFFDALPIRQFQRDGNAWRERQVGLSDNRLMLGLGAPTTQPILKDRLTDTRDGDVIEYAPALAPMAATLGTRIGDAGGVGLIIDYGDWHSLGDTLQALRAHETVDILADPGQCDLTAHVDFEALALAVPCAHTRLTPQGVFLERLGITQRAQALAASMSGTALTEHISAHRRLTHPDEMGNLFKVLGLFPDGKSPPAGLLT